MLPTEDFSVLYYFVSFLNPPGCFYLRFTLVFRTGATSGLVTKVAVQGLGAQLRQGSNAGSGDPDFTGGSVTLTLPDNPNCKDYRFICFEIAPDNNKYVDSNPNNNYKCAAKADNELKCPPSKYSLFGYP